MSLLNNIVTYWYECIKTEDFFEKNIDINFSKKAIIPNLDFDPFIFNINKNDKKVEINNNKDLNNFYNVNISTKDPDIYYGYPILIYKENAINKIAPLFNIKIKISYKDDSFLLESDEDNPTLGILAFEKLGLKSEEIAVLAKKVDEFFINIDYLDSKILLNNCFEIILKETSLNIIEELNPIILSNNKTISNFLNSGIYNKSIIFTGEGTVFNANLLRDLFELKDKPDLESTSLSYLIDKGEYKNDIEKIPVLPFKTNENQIQAIKEVYKNKLTVITGPPGTGKSQFITNLLLNLFLDNKSVLFVSHTNAAVDVVDEKINSNFKNLMLRTGSKDFKLQLSNKFNSILLENTKNINNDDNFYNDYKYLESLDKIIKEKKQFLLKIDKEERDFEFEYKIYHQEKEFFLNNYKDFNLEDYFKNLSQDKYNKINTILKKINDINNKKIKFLIKILSLFIPNYFIKKKINLFRLISNTLTQDIIKIVKFNKLEIEAAEINDSDLQRLQKFLELYEFYEKLEVKRKILSSYPSRIDLENLIIQYNEEFLKKSYEIILNNYVKLIIGSQQNTGDIKAFFNSLSFIKLKLSDNFLKVLSNLKIWSCTLKSLKGTFPLKANLFDYVIFDEASQVDLPAAAPALYRARNLIVVGDPMQLSHISVISENNDLKIAKKFNLDENTDLYPSKIRYIDISLYKSAEHCLKKSPIFLYDHYRSADQIIRLCNEIFYNSQLRIRTNLDVESYPSNLPIGIEWLDCKGEVKKIPNGSRINYIEANQVKTILLDIIDKLEKSGHRLLIGITAPYSAQEEFLTKIISSSIPKSLIEKYCLKIQTINKFQGSEKDIMIFSPTICSSGDANSDRWFNSYPQILNVALSRARFLLYIVGDYQFAKSRKGILGKIVKKYEEIKKQEIIKYAAFNNKFDTFTEKFLYDKLIKVINPFDYGYEIKTQFFFKRYILDFVLIGPKKINIECD